VSRKLAVSGFFAALFHRMDSKGSILILKFELNYSNFFLEQDASPPYDEKRVISLPLYFNNSREKIVTKLDVPCDGNHAKWLQMGAALIMKPI
jgi:hypothetical protein